MLPPCPGPPVTLRAPADLWASPGPPVTLCAPAPVATELHPVWFDYGRRYQEILAERMGGPNGNPAFGPLVAKADVHWRLVAATGWGLPHDAEDDEAWRDAALAGSSLALGGLVEEALNRAPQLAVLRVVADSVLNPSIEVTPRRDGLAVTHPRAGEVQRRLDRDESNVHLAERRRSPAFAGGFDWALEDEDGDGEALVLDYEAWLSVAGRGTSRLRFDASVLDLSWSVSGRQEVVGRLSAIASARTPTEEEGGGRELGRWSAGVLYALDDGWSVRFERIVTSEGTTWMLNLRAERRTLIPARLVPPLGSRDGSGLPWVPESGGNVVDGEFGAPLLQRP